MALAVSGVLVVGVTRSSLVQGVAPSMESESDSRLKTLLGVLGLGLESPCGGPRGEPR